MKVTMDFKTGKAREFDRVVSLSGAFIKNEYCLNMEFDTSKELIGTYDFTTNENPVIGIPISEIKSWTCKDDITHN